MENDSSALRCLHTYPTTDDLPRAGLSPPVLRAVRLLATGVAEGLGRCAGSILCRTLSTRGGRR
jgi:hypothetical protein